MILNKLRLRIGRGGLIDGWINSIPSEILWWKALREMKQMEAEK